jgi:NAD(P)-dependent dehydrogenase (short-subunit alcohol dehydrogenase family)
MHKSPIALITGANRGIGFEAARQLGNAGFIILVGSRDETRGQGAIARLSEANLDAHLVRLDVAEESSVEVAAREVAERWGHVDVLINNAGVNYEFQVSMTPLDLTLEVLRRTYAVNVFGAFLMMKHFAPLLRQSKSPRIVNVSARLGSLAVQSDPGGRLFEQNTLAYNSSKAALNNLTIAFAKVLKKDGVAVNSICPGWVRTDMGGDAAPRSAAEGVSIILQLATMPNPPSGKYLDESGPVPW